jgi:hypothetical protein
LAAARECGDEQGAGQADLERSIARDARKLLAGTAPLGAPTR